jgi:hypothetical protein
MSDQKIPVVLIRQQNCKAEGFTERVESVLHNIIQPVCDETQLQLKQPNEHSLEPVVGEIAACPIAIAVIGPPPWDADFMISLGFRLNTGKPLVLLTDPKVRRSNLPAGLRNLPRISLEPESDDETKELLHNKLQEQKSNSGVWSSNYPIIDIQVPVGATDDEDSTTRFIQANKEAAEFYGCESVSELLSTSVDKADEKLKSFMCKEQAQQFDVEQNLLFGQALRGNAVTASIPAWFTNHPVDSKNRRPYWPVLLSRRAKASAIIMRIAFIDLKAWQQAGQPGSQSIIEIPKIFRPRAFKYDIFLCHNSKDKPTVSDLSNVLRSLGLRTWFDENDLLMAGSMSSQIATAIDECRVVCVVLGNSGLGEWQQEEMKTSLFDALRKKRPFVLLLLDDVNDTTTEWLNNLPLEFRSKFSDILHGKLPPREKFKDLLAGDRFLTRVVKVFSNAFREAEAE